MPDPWQRSGLVALARCGVLLALLAALFVLQTTTATGPVNALVLLATTDAVAATAAREQLAREIEPTATVTFHPAADDISAVLRNVLWSLDPAANNAIIAASDGHFDPESENALQQAAAAGVPVFWLPLAPPEVAPEVVRVLAPYLARAGQRIGVTVEVRVAGPADIVLIGNNGPLQRAPALQSGPVNFELEVPSVGPLMLGVEIRDPGSSRVIAMIEQGALVNVAAPPSILVAANDNSLFAMSLRRGGWSVTQLSSRELAGALDTLPDFAALVLDDIGVGDLPADAWSVIARAVRRDGMGLLVLGGPDAFGRGGYRDSELESLLPVISEPPADESPVSLVFLIDISGSMDRAASASRRLQLARQAVAESAKALRPSDRVGLITFDVAARVLLAAESRPDHAAAIAEVWPDRASGGTRLLPALRLAVDALQLSDSEQKLLVLLTDGFLSALDVPQIAEVLGDTGIELIGLVIDDGNQSGSGPLSALEQSDAARIVRVDDVLRLPALMQDEIAATRPAVVMGKSLPVSALPSAMLPADADWPPLNAYSLTRPRADALVHLQSARGDVLIASSYAGAGRVVAMTSGFSGWTERWLNWAQWPEIAASLTHFIAAQSESALMISWQRQTAHRATLKVEFQGQAAPAEDLVATLVSPANQALPLALELQSPAQLAADLPLSGFGQYALTLSAPNTNVRYRFLHRQNEPSPLVGRPLAEDWLDRGLLELWRAGALGKLASTSHRVTILLGLALCIFVLLLAFERFPPGWTEWVQRPRAWLPLFDRPAKRTGEY